MDSSAGGDVNMVMEELPPVELGVLIVRVDHSKDKPPAAQELIVIRNEPLQKVFSCKWDYHDAQGPPQFRIEKPRPFAAVPSAPGTSFVAVSADSSIYLIGGYSYFNRPSKTDYRRPTNRVYCMDASKVLENSMESLCELSSMRACRFRPPSVADVGGKKIYVFGGLVETFCPTDPWAEVYDIENDMWETMDAPPGGAEWIAIDCVLWESKKHMKKMIVVFLRKIEDVGSSSIIELKIETKLSYYDLEEHNWVYNDDKQLAIDNGLLSIMVVVDDTLYLVQGANWYKYDVHLKCVIGKVKGLERMKELLGVCSYDDSGNELADTPKDIVYLGGSASHVMFCIFWEGYNTVSRCLYFALIKVDDDGSNLTATISSVAEIPVTKNHFFIKCTHVMPCNKDNLVKNKNKNKNKKNKNKK